MKSVPSIILRHIYCPYCRIYLYDVISDNFFFGVSIIYHLINEDSEISTCEKFLGIPSKIQIFKRIFFNILNETQRQPVLNMY